MHGHPPRALFHLVILQSFASSSFHGFEMAGGGVFMTYNKGAITETKKSHFSVKVNLDRMLRGDHYRRRCRRQASAPRGGGRGPCRHGSRAGLCQHLRPRRRRSNEQPEPHQRGRTGGGCSDDDQGL